MSYICNTFLLSDGFPETLNSCNKFLFRLGFNLSPNILLQLVPHVLYGVCVVGLWRRLPPMNIVVKHELPCKPRCMFGIIVLHVMMSIDDDVPKKGEQSVLQNLDV